MRAGAQRGVTLVSPGNSEAVSEDVGESRATFEAALGPLLPRLFRFCLTLCRNEAEAEDLLQDGLVRAYERRDRFAGRGSMFAWLCSILRNQFADQRRLANRRGSLLEAAWRSASEVLNTLWTGTAATADPEAQAMAGQQVELLVSSLRKLPEGFRMVVLLCDVEELSYDEAAAALELPVGTVKSRHSRGRAQLTKVYEKAQARQTVLRSRESV